MKQNYGSIASGILLFAGSYLNAQCPVPSQVTASPSVMCSGATTSLNATAVGSSIYWYTVGVGGTPIGSSPSGSNFAVSPVNTTTYYAESYEVGTNTLNYTGAVQYYTVPVGITQVTITAWGAQGWSGTNQGGQGGYARGELAVTPGQILNVYVGGAGTVANGNFMPAGGGFNGGGNGQSNGATNAVGGGGGASDVRVGGVALANRVIVGGGGGSSTNNTGCYGGNGGGLTAANGGSLNPYLPGTGGSQVAGGNIGGTLGQGGNATGTMTPWNGGGGGGYYGGGCPAEHTGGGGGSSYIGGVTNGSVAIGGNMGHGKVIITAASCLSAQRTAVIVTVNPTPSLTVNSGSICLGNSFSISPSGANTYTIQGGNAVVSPTTNTNYTVVGTSSAGCVSQVVTSSVTVNALQIPTITVNSGSICSGSTFTMNPGGASTYTFQGGNAIVSPTSNASYTVVGTNSLGCVSQSFATSNVTVAALPSLSVAGTGSVCKGATVTFTLSGADTYSWNTGATTSTLVQSPSVTTNYTATGTSTAGCSSSFTFALIVDPCTGIEDNAAAMKNLSVYPNPVSNELMIGLDNGSEKIITVTDYTGKTVYTTKTNSGLAKVNLSQLSNGIYLVKVQSNDAVRTVKILKQ